MSPTKPLQNRKRTLRQSNVSTVSAVFKKVYLWMTLALVVSGMTSMYVASQPALIAALFSSKLSFIILLLVQIGLVWFISARIARMTSLTSTLLFNVYAIVTGMTLSVIFLVFTTASIVNVFFITAAMFAGISIYGYVTDSDLSSWGGILMMALIGLIITTIVNWFIQSETLYWIITYVGVLVFVGLTVYDTQKIKKMVQQCGPYDSETVNKIALMGALTLYLDFINLFLELLRILGKRK